MYREHEGYSMQPEKTHVTNEAFKAMAHGMTKDKILNHQADGCGGSTSFLMSPSGMPENNPLKRGSSKKTISENIKMEMKHGRPQKQAIAMSMKTAGKSRKK